MRKTNKYEPDEIEPGIELDRAGYYWACEYYRLNCDLEKAIGFLKTWAKKSGNDIILQGIEKINKYKIKSTVPWIARLKTRGNTVPEESEIFFNEEIHSLETLIIDTLKSEKKISTTKVEYHALKKDDNALCDLEEAIDSIMTGKAIDKSKLLEGLGRSPIKLSKTGKIYSIRLQEIEGIKNDSDLKKSYSAYSKETIQELLTLYRDIVEYCKTTAENVRRQTAAKPRKKKKVSLDKIVKDVKYMRHDKELNITSLSAEKVIGSTILIAYDTKSRMVRIYEANDKESLTFKGVSLVNFDQEKSRMKILRNPSKQLNSFMTGGRRAVFKAFDEIKASQSSPSPRSNENLLFLRVF